VTAVLLALAILAPQRHILIDNATTTVTRVRFGRDAREAVHSNPFPLVILQLTPGDVDFAIADTRASGPREAGLVTFVAANTPYAVANAGTAPFNLITIALKPYSQRKPADEIVKDLRPKLAALQRNLSLQKEVGLLKIAVDVAAQSDLSLVDEAAKRPR